MIFLYLPHTIKTAEALELLKRQDERASRFSLSYDSHKRLSTDDVALIRLVSQAVPESVIVLYDITQITDMTKFKDTLVSRQFDNVTVRVLSPELSLNPNDRQSFEFLKALSSMQLGPRAVAHPVGTKKITPDIKERMRRDRVEGATYREIASKYAIATKTAYKHTSDVSAIRKEREASKEITKDDQSFDYEGAQGIWGDNRLGVIFVEYLKQHVTIRTKDTYKKDLARFRKFYDDTGSPVPKDPKEITVDTGQAYRDHLVSGNYGASTVRKYIGAVRAFLKYCLRRGYVVRNEWEGIKTPGYDKRSVKAKDFSKKQVEKMIETAFSIYKNKRDAIDKSVAHRNFIAIYLFSNVGMRAGALLALKRKDLHLEGDSPYLNLKSKGSESYRVTINEATVRVLERYLEQNFTGYPDDSYLIFKRDTARERPISNGAMNNIVQTIQKAAKIKGRFSTHSFRTTWATLAYGHIEIKEMQMRLGHKTLEQTMAYIRLQLSRKEADTSFIPSGGVEEVETLDSGGF